MRLLTVLLFISIIGFTGCADKDAFSKFKLVKDEELAFDNVMFAKVLKDDQVYAVASAIHLNAVYPKRYTLETFYIIIFAKNKKLLENFTLTLNGKKVLALEKLPPQNEYAHLLRIENQWSNYYLAKFPTQKTGTLTLKITLSNQAQAILTFQKK